MKSNQKINIKTSKIKIKTTRTNKWEGWEERRSRLNREEGGEVDSGCRVEGFGLLGNIRIFFSSSETAPFATPLQNSLSLFQQQEQHQHVFCVYLLRKAALFCFLLVIGLRL
jgi:hypothetical protein